MTFPLEFNRLLARLPHGDLNAMIGRFETVDLECGQRLYTAGQRMDHVYFPLSSFISLVATVDRTTSLEVGLIGREGMLGVPLVLGMSAASWRALVNGPGPALRMNAMEFRRELARNPVLRNCLERYLYVQMAQVSQLAACAHFHAVEPRLATWLLLVRDRSYSDHFRLKHEAIADMLGVRRSGITIAAGALKNRNLISYSRGDITIRDRRGLEERACSCYRALNIAYSRVMG